MREAIKISRVIIIKRKLLRITKLVNLIDWELTYRSDRELLCEKAKHIPTITFRM